MRQQSIAIDLAKVACAHLIMFHHFVLYGPLPSRMGPVGAAVTAWLEDYAKMAVQVFLVIGGYLCAASLHASPTWRGASHASLLARVGALMASRYRRLAPTYFLAAAAVVALTWLLRNWLPPEEISQMTVARIAANLLMLQDILGYTGLSAGFWYASIDLQLYALFAVTVVTCRSKLSSTTADTAVIGATIFMTTLSLYSLNLQQPLEVAFPYFMGAYGLGSLAFLLSQPRYRDEGVPAGWIVICVGAVALWIEWRTRIALATSTAAVLCHLGRIDAQLARLPPLIRRRIGQLSQASYQIFLLHYPVLLLTTAFAVALAKSDAEVNVLLPLIYWVGAVLAGRQAHALLGARFLIPVSSTKGVARD